jgi:hypothetical protein
MDIQQEVEATRIGIYCDIVSLLIKEHERLSLPKTIVFSFLIKKDSMTPNSIFTAINKKDLVSKYLSLLSGNLSFLFVDYEYIIKAIHILIKNNLINLSGQFLLKTEKLNALNFIYIEKEFTKNAIEKSKILSEKQFMREVFSNV